jgi:hypothetical protein
LRLQNTPLKYTEKPCDSSAQKFSIVFRWLARKKSMPLPLEHRCGVSNSHNNEHNRFAEDQTAKQKDTRAVLPFFTTPSPSRAVQCNNPAQPRFIPLDETKAAGRAAA